MRTDYARILTLSLPDPARHPCAEALIAATVEDLIDDGALADGAIGHTALAARLRTDYARDPTARNQAAMVLTAIALAIDTGNDALADALARGTAGIPMTLTPQDLPLPSESEALYALEDCHYEAVQSWLEEYDWQALVGAAIRTPQQV